MAPPKSYGLGAAADMAQARALSRRTPALALAAHCSCSRVSLRPQTQPASGRACVRIGCRPATRQLPAKAETQKQCSFHLLRRPPRLQVAIARTVGGKFTAVRPLPLPARGCLPARKGWPMCCGPVRHGPIQAAASGGCTAHTAPTTRCCYPASPLLFCRLTRARSHCVHRTLTLQ